MSTPKQLAEKIGIEHHGEHVRAGVVNSDYWANKGITPSWPDFLICPHEICEGSRTLIGHLEYQARLLKDCEIFLGTDVWAEISGKQEVSP